MKRNKLIAILAGAIALTTIGTAGYAADQTFNNLKQSVLPITNPTEFKMNELTPAEEAQQWQEMKQRFTDVGINLTPQQEITIRQAQRQLAVDMRELFKDNPLITIGQLITASTLPQQQGEAFMKMTGLDERLGNPLLSYRNSVLNALTPEQRPIWEQRIWQRQGEQTQTTQNNFQITTPTPAEKAQEWEKTKQRFRNAGVPLTPQQETQMQAANAKLDAELTQEFQTNPSGTFARLFAVAILPASASAPFAENLLGESIITHLRSMDEILTPEQRQVWERGWSERSQG